MERVINDQVVREFLDVALAETTESARAVDLNALNAAVTLILEAETQGGRLHITGIGKPGHVAEYMASLFSSTGTPAYFLHGTEAVHGSCGQLRAGDVVICISNSGETAEMRATATAIRNNGCKIISVTGKPDSWLARMGEVHLFAGVEEEGGPLNRAPRASILAETLVLQALSVALQEHRNLTPQEYVLRHPGGSLGVLREDER
jgi:KpsF/GutQ family protein